MVHAILFVKRQKIWAVIWGEADLDILCRGSHHVKFYFFMFFFYAQLLSIPVFLYKMLSSSPNPVQYK